MYKKPVIAVLAALIVALPILPVHAQSTPAKKALVARILKAQQPGIEGMSRAMVERPAIAMVDSAAAALQERVSADKREAVGKEIQTDVKKYLDDAVPVVTSRALKLAPTTIGPFLEEKFTEDELKQVAAFLESAAFNKYQQLSGEMQKVLMEKVLLETRSTVDPKVAALEQTVGKRLGIVPTPAAAPK